jgi:hypothetical protein
MKKLPKDVLHQIFKGYILDPADSDHQRGFLACALEVYRASFGEPPEANLLDAQVQTRG